MKKAMLFLFAFFYLLFSNNLYVNAAEGDSIIYKRNLWFYAQRFNPYDSIPPGAMQIAISERNALIAYGYFLNPMSSNWINIGPNYPWNGGRINFVKYLDDNTVIVGTPHAGLWKSTDNSTWVSMDPNNQLGSNHSGAIAIDNSHNPPFIYYGTGEGIYSFDYAYFGKGIFKTTDWGNTWIEINNGLPINLHLKVFRITIRPEYPDEIFAATNQGLYRTSSGGINWFVIDGTFGKNCNDIKFSTQEPLKAFLVGPSESNRYTPGVGYRESTDGGLTFELKDRGFNPSGRSHMEVFELNDNYIYVITDIDDNTKLYRSTNGGINYVEKYATNMTNYGGYVMSLKIVPPEQGDVPADIYLGGINLYKSTNSGENFCIITGIPTQCGYSNPNQHADNHFIDFKPSSFNDLLVVNDGGIINTTDGGFTWGSKNSNLSLSLIYRINSGPNGTFLGLQDNGIGTLISPKYPYGDGGEVIISKYNPSIVLYNENNNGNIRRSVDGGSNYSIISIPGFWGTAGADWLGAMIEHPTVAGIFYHAKRNSGANKINFWKSSDYGATWGGNTPFGSVDALCAPQTIAISSKEPEKIYMSSSGFFGDYPFLFGRGLFKSTNGGEFWGDPIIAENDEQTIPFKYITRVVTAPSENSSNPDEVYLTLSGFEIINEGHVFKSTNEGSSWININGNLPNIPVNDIVWWQSSCENLSKTIAVATDVGVFSSTNEGETWKLLADGLPIVPVMDLEYVQYKKSLRAATFGRGVWEVDLEGDIYIKDITTMPSNSTFSKNIVICNGGELNINNALLTINDNKQIIIKNGGKLVGGTDAAFYSSNSWNGIVVEPGGELILNGCYFDQTSTPITIEGDAFIQSPAVTITNCNFLNNTAIGTITINNRDNVTINSCKWSYPGSLSVFNKAIDCYNSNDILIDDNDFNIITETNADISAIFIDYGNDIVISNNNIKNLAKGITVSNSSPFIYRNNIEYTVDPVNNVTGAITLSNSYSANLKQNNIINYQTGIKLQNSSPLLFENDFINNLEEATALVCETNSSPRLRQQESGGQTIWDAGKNEFEALYTYQNVNYGVGLNIANYSFPDLEFGCNTINTSSYTFSGHIAYCIGAYHYLFARHNIWNNYSENICDADWETFPPGCYEGSGGSEKENDPPPQPIVINYGNGIYDTIQVTTRNVQVNTDQALYLSANNDEITGNYLSAVTKYEQIIQDYQDSLAAINSLRKLLHCRDKMNSDTTAYSQLRSYFQGKIQLNLTDTVFVNVAEELAAKCLVRMGKPTNAIDEYEVIISNTNDSSKILCAELNVIETYLIIQNSGDSPNYTGQLGYLKPATKEDAYKKIMDRLHKNKKNNANNTIPKVFKLSQNYPNPFNPITKINYSLPRAVKVNIQVYDILGRLVKTLVNEFKEAGNYEVQFDGTGLASGVYFYRIEAGDFVDSKKMVLVK